jgi:uncharacterized protein (DUF1015 family)
MSTTIEINETVYNLEIETAYSDVIKSLDIEISSNSILEISSGFVGNVVFAGDIIGLDNYIANFIDEYEIDCGTP